MGRTQRGRGLVAGTMLAALVMVMGAGEGAGAVRASEWQCPVDAPVAPDDGFVSGGIGLTCAEWVARYGPPDEIGQGPMIYGIGGFRVFGMGSPGLRLRFDDESWQQDGDFPNEFQAAISFLPEDAEHLGVADLATGLRSYQASHVYFSPSLAERNAAMGLPWPGAILVVTTFDQDGMERGRVESVEVIQTALRG